MHALVAATENTVGRGVCDTPEAVKTDTVRSHARHQMTSAHEDNVGVPQASAKKARHFFVECQILNHPEL
jgi:hypothetical protein